MRCPPLRLVRGGRRSLLETVRELAQDYHLHLALTTGDVPMLLASARACASEPRVRDEEPWLYELCADIARAAPSACLRDDLLVWTRYGKDVEVGELLADLAPFLSHVLDDEHCALLGYQIDDDMAEAFEIAPVTDEEHEAWPRPASGPTVGALDAQGLRARAIPLPSAFPDDDDGPRRIPKPPATAHGGFITFLAPPREADSQHRSGARLEPRPEPIADPLRDLDAYLAYVRRAHDDYATWGWNGAELSVKELSRRVARLPEARAVVWSPGGGTVSIRWHERRARAFELDCSLSFDPAFLPR